MRCSLGCVCRACRIIQTLQHVGFDNCLSKAGTWHEKSINDEVLADLDWLTKNEGHEAAVADALDLNNLRGFCTGKVGMAIQHIATILESPLALACEGSVYNHRPKRSKYSNTPVQPCCYSGRDDAHLPKAVKAGEPVPTEDLVVARCRQLIYGTQAAASREGAEYRSCLRLLVGLLWLIRDVR